MRSDSDKGRARMNRSEWLILAAILAAGAILRILFLGRCALWQDEMGFITLANPQFGVGEIARQSWDLVLSIGQQPLGFILQNLYMKMVSPFVPDVMFNPFWARLHWLLWGVAAIAGVFFVARLTSGLLTASISAALFAVSFYPVFYAREVYPYAGVMAAASFSIYCAYRHVFTSETKWKWAILASIGSLVLVYLHMNGVLFFGISATVIGVRWLRDFVLRRKDRRPPWAGQLNRLVLCFMLVGVAVAPYFLRFVLLNKAHTQGSPFSLWVILQDPVARFFLGENPAGLAVGWIVLLTGMIAVIRRRDPRGPVTGMLVATVILTWLFVGFSTSRSQYLSARYFAPLAPLCFWIFAEGLAFFAGMVKPARMRTITASVLALAYASIHLVVFLPGLYSLRDKDIGFGKIAAWLNEHLPVGSPYLMESGYELRWVSGYHPTPGRTGAAPYVHGGSPGDLDELHRRQIEFMNQFPESPFVESAHHNAGSPEGIWSWPHQNFRQRVRLSNEPLRDLVSRGIFPKEPGTRLLDTDFRVDIYYNSWDDRLVLARERGEPVLFRFDGWRVGGQPVAPNATDYYRIAPDARSSVTITRISEQPVRGDLLATVAVISDMPSESITFELAGMASVGFSITPGQFVQIPLNRVQISEPETILEIRHRGESVKALLLRNIEFRRER